MVPWAESTLTSTARPLSFGRYREAGTSRLSFPSLTSIIAATDVIGFVIEAMLNAASGSIGRPATGSRTPNARW